MLRVAEDLVHGHLLAGVDSCLEHVEPGCQIGELGDRKLGLTELIGCRDVAVGGYPGTLDHRHGLHGQHPWLITPVRCLNRAGCADHGRDADDDRKTATEPHARHLGGRSGGHISAATGSSWRLRRPCQPASARSAATNTVAPEYAR